MLFRRESADGDRQVQLKKWKLALRDPPNLSPATYFSLNSHQWSCRFSCSNLVALLLDLGKHQLPPSSGLCKGCFFYLERSSLLTLTLLDSLQTRKCCFRSLMALRHREIALSCKVDLFLVLDQILSSCVLWVTLHSLKINLHIRKTELKMSTAPHPQRRQRIA